MLSGRPVLRFFEREALCVKREAISLKFFEREALCAEREAISLRFFFVLRNSRKEILA